MNFEVSILSRRVLNQVSNTLPKMRQTVKRFLDGIKKGALGRGLGRRERASDKQRHGAPQVGVGPATIADLAQ